MLAGCCAGPAPEWQDLETLYLSGEPQTVDLSDWVSDSKHTLEFTATSTDEVIAELDGSRLTLTPQPNWNGQVAVGLSVTDNCDGTDSAILDVSSGSEPTNPTAPTGVCLTEITYQPADTPEGVAVAGDFNDWSTDAHPLTENADGTWSVLLDLPEGNYGYKLVEQTGGAFGSDEQWFCDPSADRFQCDAGYKEPWETDWDPICAPGVESCNSLLVVRPCGPPELVVSKLEIDRDANAVSATVEVGLGGGGAIEAATATHNGQPIENAWDGQRFELNLTDLADGRHTLRFTVTDASGNTSDEAYVPFWTDDREWESGVMYFAFVDRMKNARTDLDTSEGATANIGGYEGGDLQGLTEMLPYLDELGVTVLWLSNAQDNTEGAWSGDCDQTYAGYHAYWPDDPFGVEEHFGSDQDLHTLVDEAHARGIRVIMDWVANHVHETHPYYAEHPEWFNDYAHCKDYVDGQINFDRIPETCWFAPYLPDIDYGHPDALVTMVDDAIWWAKTYELDGFRADAVKHMSHAVNWNLATEIHRQIEHTEAGGDENFYTVGETFDSNYALINAYVGPNKLDGQFDFPLYFSMRSTFISGGGPMADVVGAMDTSLDQYNGALMSTFLGNHDVLRFVTDAAEGWQDPCYSGQIRNAQAPSDPWATDRLKLGWTFLFTQPNIPLIYYGDELGIPGYADPDNRQPLWWHTGGDLTGVDTVGSMLTRVGANEGSVLKHVQALATARADHPALYTGARIQWWEEWDVYAYASSDGTDQVLTVLNRSETDRQLTNSLTFAGLPADGTFRDILTDQLFVASGDSITIDVPARGSRVLVLE